MRMTIEEKKVLYAFGCTDHINTVNRLKWLATMTVDPKVKKMIMKLALKLASNGVQDWYCCFFYNLRLEMEDYFNAQALIKLAEISTIEVEGYDYEADEV